MTIWGWCGAEIFCNMKYLTKSPRETEDLGKNIAQNANKTPRKNALVLALDGPLGGGKTTFTKGFFKAVGAKGTAVSPTFILMRRIGLPRGNSLYHVDLYRLPHPRLIRVLEFPRLFRNPKNIVVIEWAKHAAALLPKAAVRVSFEHGHTEKERVIIVKG